MSQFQYPFCRKDFLKNFNHGWLIRDANMFWDFISLRPETTHQVMITFSDRGIPDGYRYMHGYGSHTFKMVNHKKEAVYVKFHYKTDQGIRNLSSAKAANISGIDPDYAIRDLYNAIARGDFPTWTFYIQVMTFHEAKNFRWNPFDLTKVWPQEDFPLIPVGKVVLNQNPSNYFAEVEQIGFSPAHMIPGIEPSPDKMLHSVIVPIHNGEAWIDDCFEAIQLQSAVEHLTLEVSAYDDSSTDNTWDMLQAWKEKLTIKGIKFVLSRNESSCPRGVGFAKNHAVEQSSGVFLCFQDVDDIMLPDRILHQYEAAQENENACAVSSTQKFLVQQHITTSKHQANKQLNSKQRQLFLTQPTTSNHTFSCIIKTLKSLQNRHLSLSESFEIINSTVEQLNRGRGKVADAVKLRWTLYFQKPWI
ncbi:hypothetical protein ANN_20685 [Periplaneta americana]|uniref:Catalase core domain-containing protein n=1 Tax=Periplaneta americana TaxID=6978 RepID=A0ABQ8SD96_PERAM|nr:hypothetical protein ANN_20685 [Periplaneta americana]